MARREYEVIYPTADGVGRVMMDFDTDLAIAELVVYLLALLRQQSELPAPTLVALPVSAPDLQHCGFSISFRTGSGQQAERLSGAGRLRTLGEFDHPAGTTLLIEPSADIEELCVCDNATARKLARPTDYQPLLVVCEDGETSWRRLLHLRKDKPLWRLAERALALAREHEPALRGATGLCVSYQPPGGSWRTAESLQLEEILDRLELPPNSTLLLESFFPSQAGPSQVDYILDGSRLGRAQAETASDRLGFFRILRHREGTRQFVAGRIATIPLDVPLERLLPELVTLLERGSAGGRDVARKNPQPRVLLRLDWGHPLAEFKDLAWSLHELGARSGGEIVIIEKASDRGTRPYTIEYPSHQGVSRLNLEPDLGVPLRQLVPQLIELIRRSPGIPEPLLEFAGSGHSDGGGFGVSFRRSEHQPREEVGREELDWTLADFDHPDLTIMTVELSHGIPHARPKAARARLARPAAGSPSAARRQAKRTERARAQGGDPPRPSTGVANKKSLHTLVPLEQVPGRDPGERPSPEVPRVPQRPQERRAEQPKPPGREGPRAEAQQPQERRAERPKPPVQDQAPREPEERDYYFEYQSADGLLRLQLQLEDDVPLRKLVSEILASIRQNDDVPDPAFELDTRELRPSCAVYFQKGEFELRDRVTPADWDRTLAELDHPPFTAMIVEPLEG